MSTPPKDKSDLSGLEPEAQEAAKLAARKAGVSLEEWLSQTIRAAATQELKHGGKPPGDQSTYDQTAPEPHPAPPYGGQAGYGPPPPPGYNGYYGHPAQGGYAPPPPPPPGGTAPPPAPTIQALYDNIKRLVARVEEMEARAAENIEPIARRVTEITRKLEESDSAKSASVAPVERAVVRLSERLEELENKSREPERRSLFGRRSRRS